MLEKIFKRSKKAEPDIIDPGILFGRYSDNNKPVEKVEKWNEADTLFKEKKYKESIQTFFLYFRVTNRNKVFYKNWVQPILSLL